MIQEWTYDMITHNQDIKSTWQKNGIQVGRKSLNTILSMESLKENKNV